MLFMRDKEKYRFVGYLENHINGDRIKFRYRYTQNETMENDFYDNKQHIIMTCTIEIEGNPSLMVRDKIVLQNGNIYSIFTLSPLYQESNVLVSELVKQKPTAWICELR